MKIRKQRTKERTLKIIIDDKKRRLEMLTENLRAECIKIRNNKELEDESLLNILRQLKNEFNIQHKYIEKQDSKINRENLFGISTFQDYDCFYEYKIFFDEHFSMVRSNLSYIQYYIPYEGEYKDFLEYFVVY